MISPISLSDHQLQLVADAAARLSVEKRAAFLERIGAMLTLRGRFNDDDVGTVVRLALQGLVRESAA
jgi:hypothetical protein